MNELLARHESSYIYSNSERSEEEYVLSSIKEFRRGELAHEYIFCSAYEDGDLVIGVISEEKMYAREHEGSRLFGGESTGFVFKRLFPFSSHNV